MILEMKGRGKEKGESTGKERRGGGKERKGD